MIAILLSTVLSTTLADEVRAAAADVERLPRHVQPGVRYLTLYNVEPAKRADAVQVVNYTLNALSRARTITHATPVSPTLLRFNIAQYAPQADESAEWSIAWEKLAESDPYFHLRTEVVAARHGGPLAQPLNGDAARTVTTDGGWVDLAAAARLRAATHSIGAILRADDFVARATVPPRYHEFAGIAETENEFVKSLGLDREVIDRLRANAGANVIISGVTGKPRRIVWSQGPLGGVYATLDVERVDAQRDPLRRPVTVQTGRRGEKERGRKETPQINLAFRYDASEWFAVAPNGLWRTAIFNAEGKRQDSVPDRVAKDTSDPHGEGIIVPMLSCIRCHRESGLRPFVDDQTRLLSGRVDLFSDDPKIVQRAAEFYDEPRLQRQMRFDRETYAAAVERATTTGAMLSQSVSMPTLRDGMAPDDHTTSNTATALNPEELADRLAAFVRQFAYLPIAPEQAAAEVGLTLEQFRAALSATHDPILLTLLEGRPVLRGQWESSFAEAALTAATFHQAADPIRGDVQEDPTAFQNIKRFTADIADDTDRKEQSNSTLLPDPR